MKAAHKIRILSFSISCFLLLFTIDLNAQEDGNSIKFSAEDDELQWGPCPEFMPEGCNIAVLHGNPAEKNADIFFKVPANAEIPNHRHTSVERMIMVQGELEVIYEGEEPVLLKEGDYAFGPADKPHSATCGDEPCILFIAFEDPVDAIPVED